MTKKHFEAIAKAFQAGIGHAAGNEVAETTLWGVAEEIADYCATQNPNFDANRFLNACRPS